MPPVKSAYFPLSGGLDLVTPAMSMPPGRTFDCMNYEPEISGGYRRIDGYERFDGSPSPHDKSTYAILKATLTDTIPLGFGLNGEESGVGGRVVALYPKDGYTLIVLSGPTGNEGVYMAGEKLIRHDGITAGFANEDSAQADFPIDDAEYRYAATEDLRSEIHEVPGAGPIRAIFTLDDNVYAFRDEEAGTYQRLWKSSPLGWVEVNLGMEIQFFNGTIEIKRGDVINNGSGATAAVSEVLVRTGTWTSNGEGKAMGSLILDTTAMTGSFSQGDTIGVANIDRAVARSSTTPITRYAGSSSKIDLVKYSFATQKGAQVIYGVDGYNLAFEFNGISFIPIRTGMMNDQPTKVAAHLNYLFLAFGSSIQFSAVNNPYSWTAILGAGEFSAGDNVTSMMPMIGGNQDPAMAIFTNSKVSMLYGSGQQTFRLQNAITEIGFSAGTVQPISGTAFGLSARGLQTLKATDTFGDFNFASISSKVQPLINKLRGEETCSVVLKNKNQYRVYYGDEMGTCLVVGLSDDDAEAPIMPLEYNRPVRCIWTETFSDGKERTFFGSDDGFVYEDNKGTSFDGAAIESWVRLVFNHQGSPRARKRWRRAVFEAKVEAFSRVNFSYDLGYGNPDVMPPPNTDDAIMVGGTGGYWDQFIWDSFHWDAQSVISPSVSIEGTEKNISLVFYSNRAVDGAHVLQGVTLEYTDRRNER